MAFGESMLSHRGDGKAVCVRDLAVGATVLCEDGEAACVVKLERNDFHRDGLFEPGLTRFHPIRGRDGQWVHAGFREPYAGPLGQAVYEVWLDRHHNVVSAVTGRVCLTRGHGIARDPVASHSVFGAPRA